MMIDEPELLYAIQSVNAYKVENGQEQLLTSGGPQNLLLLITSTTTTPPVPVSIGESQLLIRISPNLDLKIPTNTHVFFEHPYSYLIPQYDNISGSNSFVRIEFPSESQKKGIQDDIDTLETILSQFNVIIERNFPTLPPYDPSSSSLEKTSISGKIAPQGQLMIFDEDNGQVIGEFGSRFQIVENAHIKPGTDDPVEITLPSDDCTTINVKPVSESYLEMAMHPVYKDSALVAKAAMASKMIVTTSNQLTKTLQSQADSYTKKTKPNPKPLTFEPATHERIRKARKLTEDAAGLSAMAVGQVQKYAQHLGASLTKREKTHSKAGIGPDGKPIDNYKPGLINKGLVAISTIADGIDQAGRSLLSGTSTAVTTVVGHKYGPEAGAIASNIGGGVRNCGLVYIDATGVTRRALIKSVVKGALIGKLSDGTSLVVGNSAAYGDKKTSNEKLSDSNSFVEESIANSEKKTHDERSDRVDAKYSKEEESKQDRVNASNHVAPNIGSSYEQSLPVYTSSVSSSH